MVADMYRALRGLVLAAILAGLGGCAAFYVDGNVPEVPAAQYQKPATPTDVQLIWEFQTKGVANAKATELLKTQVSDQLNASGLFAKVSDAPVNNGALLSITVNNVPLTDDAASKGFIAGLTFGLAGQTVGDGYACTLRYLPGRRGAAPLIHSGKHVIYTSIGTGSPPSGAQKKESADEAVFTMLRQLISRTLDNLSRDPAFP
ncbi:MAG: hypothetical protein LBV61_06510 [Burkholderiaceae bacterium]|jgi:hypothetical protein|nr:hypothetical protein [Burkholderiaceae bacterium]